MTFFSRSLTAAAILTGLCSTALAETTLNVHYPMPGFFQDVMANISKKFMEENPDIKINFVSPSAT
jgi:multiple sugar transport system substrate-binding protein